MNKDNRPRFEIDPSVVYQLGDNLISDSVMALIELVKNCYDADATYAKVIVDTEGKTSIKESIYDASGGRVIVEDDGHGMTWEEIYRGWLRISNRWKLHLKNNKETTPGGRTPLGDKGLGRLGVQRLSDKLEIFTKSQNKKGYHFGFSWLDFGTAPSLDEVDVYFKEFDFPRKHGTKIVASSLKEVDIWKGQDAINRLQRELSKMISPYRKIRDFMVMVEVDGEKIELEEISDRIRDIAPLRYKIEYKERKLIIEGKARLDFFKPLNKAEQDKFALFVESDNGESFFEFLREKKTAQDLNLSQTGSDNWFVKFGMKKNIEYIDKIEKTQEVSENIADPGPFAGEIDAFNLSRDSFESQSVFDRLSFYRSFLKNISGVSVFRDGFAIRMDRDWLKLGGQQTSATSYYGLRPDNTSGFIALTARHNMNLEETTDREGFKDTPYSRNFYALMDEFKDFTLKAHNFFRRSWLEYRDKRKEEKANIDSRKSVEDISKTIKKGLNDVAAYQKSLDSVRVELKDGVAKSRNVVRRFSKTSRPSSKLQKEMESSFKELEALTKKAEGVINSLTKTQEIHEWMGVLDDRVEALRRQMDDVYETVALGLTAEALSHEVYNVANQLATRSKSAKNYLKSKSYKDRKLFAYIEHVNTAVMALRKQMSFLSPALRYVREQRHEIEVSVFLDELSDYYNNRLSSANISLSLQNENFAPFTIKMNRGKLTQIFDNLILNSEYWLKEEMTQERLSEGTILFEIQRPFVRVYDNGRGIDPTVEYSIFEPFVSTKGRGKGRGLGLFIIKQLLDSEGCSIGVLPERNNYKRLFKFQIDLRGCIYEG